eukprot:m.77341 g.77341  ORF g.77341 m.77341 type:complete len:114 (+) comp17282_c0_seq1:724-1065(+)
MWTHSKGSFFSVAFFGGVWVGSSRQALRQALLFPEDFVLHYKTFADTLKDGSMYRNAQTFMFVDTPRPASPAGSESSASTASDEEGVQGKAAAARPPTSQASPSSTATAHRKF